jgi:hypothetical protein
MGLLRRMIAHYRMMRFMHFGRWQSVRNTIRAFRSRTGR